MDTNKMIDYARRLRDAHGDRAIHEAARKAVECDESKDVEQAAVWRKVEGMLREMQGPRET